MGENSIKDSLNTHDVPQSSFSCNGSGHFLLSMTVVFFALVALSLVNVDWFFPYPRSTDPYNTYYFWHNLSDLKYPSSTLGTFFHNLFADWSEVIRYEGAHYKYSRFTWNLKGFIFFTLFEPITAYVLLHLTTLFFAVASIYFCFSPYSPKAAFVCALFLALFPGFHGILSFDWGYYHQEGAGLLLASMALLIHFRYYGNAKLMIGSGIFLSAAVLYPYVMVYSIFVFAWATWYCLSVRNYRAYLLFIGSGIGAMAAMCLGSYMITGELFPFLPQLNQMLFYMKTYTAVDGPSDILASVNPSHLLLFVSPSRFIEYFSQVLSMNYNVLLKIFLLFCVIRIAFLLGGVPLSAVRDDRGKFSFHRFYGYIFAGGRSVPFVANRAHMANIMIGFTSFVIMVHIIMSIRGTPALMHAMQLMNMYAPLIVGIGGLLAHDMEGRYGWKEQALIAVVVVSLLVSGYWINYELPHEVSRWLWLKDDTSLMASLAFVVYLGSRKFFARCNTLEDDRFAVMGRASLVVALIIGSVIGFANISMRERIVFYSSNRPSQCQSLYSMYELTTAATNYIYKFSDNNDVALWIDSGEFREPPVECKNQLNARINKMYFPTRHVDYFELIGSVRAMLFFGGDFNGYGIKDTYSKIVDVESLGGIFHRLDGNSKTQKVGIITHYQENIDTALRTLERNNINYSILGKTLIKEGYLELRIVVVELRR